MSKPTAPENLKFQELFRASGWTQADAARELQLTGGAISQYMQGQTKPSPGVIKLMQLLVERQAEDARAAAQNGGPDNLASWRRRATQAERRLDYLRNGLRSLLRESEISSEENKLEGMRTQLRKRLDEP